MKSFAPSLLAAALFVLSHLAVAQPAPQGDTPSTQGGSSSDPWAQIVRSQLDNQVRVVMDPRPDADLVTACSTWDVGLRDEGEDESGYARLVERLARRADEVEARVAQRGGTTWSETRVDRTVYCTTVPAGEIPLAVWAESSRLQPLGALPGTFERDRDRAVVHLLPQGADEPRVRGRQLLFALAFQGWWRSERTPEFSLLDIDVEDLNALIAFHARHYRPDQVVFSFSGAFDPAVAIAELERLANVPAPRDPPSRYTPPSPAPRQTSERFAAREDDGLATPLVLFAWPIPPPGTPQHRAFTLAAEVLGGGPTGSLHEQLVVRQKQAREVRAWTTQHRDVGALVVEVSCTKEATMKRLELIVSQEWRRLTAAGPTKRELSRARVGVSAGLLGRAQTSRDRATLFGEWELRAGNATLIAREDEGYAGVSSANVRDAFRQVDETAVSIVEVHPPGWYTPGAAKPLDRYHIVDRGETLIGIAKRYSISVGALTEENRIQRDKPIFPGQKLKLPKEAKAPAPPKPKPKPRQHAVKKGETLSGIAHRYGITTTALARANGLDPKRPIGIGQKLVVPPKVSAKPGSERATSRRPKRSTEPSRGTADKTTEAKPRVHVVQKGQTLSGIAHANGVSTAALARYNGLDPKKPIRIGQKLKIPPKRSR